MDVYLVKFYFMLELIVFNLAFVCALGCKNILIGYKFPFFFFFLNL